MQYLGGKGRIAKYIEEVINALSRREKSDCAGNCGNYLHPAGGGTFVSLFCGSCAVEAKVRGFDRMILNDKHKYLIALLRAVQRGYNPPSVVTEAEYTAVKANKDADPALTGFVGFGCSFGGKFFGGYARNASGTNYAAQSKRSLLEDMAALKNAEFLCGDYRAVTIPPHSVIYADPPYQGTAGYTTGKFDTATFWAYMRNLAKSGHTVLISELNAPLDFITVWERPFLRSIDCNKSNKLTVTEKLFTYKDTRLNIPRQVSIFDAANE